MRASTAAFSSPVATNTTCRDAFITGTVRVRRQPTCGTSTATASRSGSRKAGECGNSDAVCPLAPMPSRTNGFASGYARELQEIMKTAEAMATPNISARLWKRR